MTASPPDSEFRSTFTSALTSGLLPGAWLLLGLLAVVFLPLISGGWHLAGDAGDTLLNNIFLEHFYRWITGHEPSYWSPRYFYPYPWTLAWSENHLGTAWIYAMGRLFGLSREAAHFGWYLVGFIANYLAAYWVGRRLRLGSLAVAAGAFFFAFGLPLTNQEGHNQLIYRWCVPLAFYAIYSFAKHQKLRDFVSALVFLAIQIYTNLYIGAFLSLLLVLETLLLPFFVELASSQTGWRQKLLWLPSALISSWHLAPPRRRLFLSLIAAASVLAVAALA
ncbi:MAG: hypothetical protein KAI47_06015, partial [Deltaproteobacteria bacterium]|nr:hypothetical protein [Deltaproteobacteria bacterium]